MKEPRVSAKLSALAGWICLALLLPASAEEPGDWKTINSQAIAAMRSEKYQDAERLFHEALGKCKLKTDKSTVIANLQILLRKLGKEDEAAKLSEPAHKSPYENEEAQKREHERQMEASTSSKIQTQPQVPNSRSTKSDLSEFNAHIKQLDEKIKNADSRGELETLQMLFQEKADAVKLRDKSESLEYSYMLHFRAQVLVHMHRESEAKELDAYAAKIRDRNRQLIHPPVAGSAPDRK